MLIKTSGKGVPKIPKLGAPKSKGLTDRGTSKPRKIAAPKPPKPPSVRRPIVAPPKTPAAATGQQDPFEFIKSLLVSTNPDDIRKLIDPIYAPIRQQINDQIAQSQAESTARANQMKDVYAAFAQFMGGLPGQIQGIYGKGSDAYAAGQQAAAAMSGPQGAVGDHLAAGSAIDQQMNDEIGKGWAAYAAAQPGIYSLMATQNIKQMLGDANANEQKLREDLLTLSSKEADAILSYLTDAQNKDQSLQEWAYTQQQSNLDAIAKNKQAEASTQQSYLDSIQKQSQIDFNNAIVQGASIGQAQQIARNNYKKNLLQMKQQGLITAGQYQAALGWNGYQIPKSAAPKQPKVSVGLSNRYGYLVDTSGNPIAGPNGGKQYLPKKTGTAKKWSLAPEWISKQAGVIMGYDPNGQLRPYPGGGKYIPGKGGVPKTPKKGKPDNAANHPGTPAYIAALQKQRTDLQTAIGNAKIQAEKKYYTHEKGVTYTDLTPEQKARVKADLWNTYGTNLMRIARQLQLYGKLNRKYTPRQLAEYWLNTAVGY